MSPVSGRRRLSKPRGARRTADGPRGGGPRRASAGDLGGRARNHTALVSGPPPPRWEPQDVRSGAGSGASTTFELHLARLEHRDVGGGEPSAPSPWNRQRQLGWSSMLSAWATDLVAILSGRDPNWRGAAGDVAWEGLGPVFRRGAEPDDAVGKKTRRLRAVRGEVAHLRTSSQADSRSSGGG